MSFRGRKGNVDGRMTDLSSPSSELPALEKDNLFSASGSFTESTGAGTRRTAGGWRGPWARSGSKTTSDAGSVEDKDTPQNKIDWGMEDDNLDQTDRRHSVASTAPADATGPEETPFWENSHALPSMTPPGTITELPSFSITSPIGQSQPGDAPWTAATYKTGDYDWANFVYAYARGRWDPIRSPHPPSQSNVVPGATTHIGTQDGANNYQYSDMPESPGSSTTIRRPSLTYTLLGQGVSGEEMTRLPPNATASQILPTLTEDVRPKPRDLPSGQSADSSTSPTPALSRPFPEPQFIDPFNVLQLASQSTPNIGHAVSLGQEAQSRMTEDSPTKVQGSKTDTEVFTKGSLSRQSSDSKTSHPQDDSVWRATSTSSPLDRHAGILPFVPPSESLLPSKRPGFATHMSEMVLNSSKLRPKEQLTFAALNDHNNDNTLKETSHRPRPTPVQKTGLPTNEEVLEEMRLATWSSAPETTFASSSGAGISSFGHGSSNDDLGTVAGLRRAARRTSIKRSEGSQEMPRDSSSQLSQANSPLILPTSESTISRAPSTGQNQEQDGDPQPGSATTVTTASNVAEDKRALERVASSAGGQGAVSRAVPGRVTLKMPPNLFQIGQSSSSSSLATYLNVGKRVEKFFRDHGYLPAIIPPNEMNRRQALRRYGPPEMSGDQNFDRIAHLVKLVFNTKLVLITLVGEKSQYFQSEVGGNASGFNGDWLQAMAEPRDCSLCAHTILQNSNEALVILDAQKDWRFAGHPQVIGNPHVRFYAGSPLRTADGYNLGSLCIIDDEPWTEFNPRQRHTLKEFSKIVMREMELSRDSIHLRIRDRMQHSIETFTRECLEMESSDVEEKEEDNAGLHRVYDFAAKGMREALNASGAIVFDLSHFELVVSSSQNVDEEGESKIFFPSPYQFPEITPFANFDQPDSIQGINAANSSTTPLHKNAKLEEKSVPPMAVLGASELCNTPADRDRPVPLSHYLKVAEFLRKHRAGQYFPFTPAPFRHLLPAEMTSILLVPIFGLNKQPFALLCAYSKPTGDGTTLEDIKEPGLQYLRAMGTIILSAILKKDIMLADKAKSHFISNISHELRTPLHGILAAAELLAETKLSATQGSYLETVEACGKSLLELVNHVLDFTKLSGNMRSNQPQTKSTQKCDLVKLVQEVCESSWIGQMAKKLESQQNSGIGSAYAKGSEGSSVIEPETKESTHQAKQKILEEASLVETVIDVSFRPSGWLVKCDAGGIRRVLMNLIGNSLKFTTAGFVHVSVREVQSTDSHVVVELGVTDTGKGISRTFLEEQLFHPFTQENHLGPGTGLGLSIVNSIVQSPAINGKIDVWSTVGQGTEIRVTCEFGLQSPQEADESAYRPVLHVHEKHTVSLVAFQENLRGQSDLKEILRTYYEDWWKFTTAKGLDGDVVLVNDSVEYLAEIAKDRKKRGVPLPPVIMLTGGRGDAKVAGACEEYQRLGGVARLLFKPAGPAKLEAATGYCLQCLERSRAGLPMIPQEEDLEREGDDEFDDDISRVDVEFANRGKSRTSKEGDGKEYFDPAIMDDKTPGAEGVVTPKADLSFAHADRQVKKQIRPHINDDLRQNSHHVSPAPPAPEDAVCLGRRHSNEDRLSKRNRGLNSPQSAIETTSSSHARPSMPARSITYHEPRLQRQVLMSPLRSPAYNKKAGEASDYFGSVASSSPPNPPQSRPSSSASSLLAHENTIPSSPGSVVSLEGGEGAVLKTAIQHAGVPRGGTATTTRKRLQVLTVEDNHINRKVLAAFLDKLNADYVEATNGEEGVKVFESYPPHHFDVIFMDLSMPVLDGIGATIQIRKIEAERFRKDKGVHHPAWMKATKTTPLMLSTPGGTRPSAQTRAKIFTLTGRSSDEDKRRAFQTGADAYLVKPLGFKVLSSLLSKVSAL
ncbi:hypothetical protein CBS101457_004531 [Exobasidium rhododendri]|nr:hypothetical protein CBS101457_004531 [Exobasidium rhododendri]